MSQEAAPERAVPEQSAPPSVPEQKAAGAPKGLLQQMEELMAALSADLSQLDADIQSSADRLDPEPTPPGTDRPGPEHPDADQYCSDQRGHGSEHREGAGHEPDGRPAADGRPAPGDARPLF
ncbi:hypothetical protein [Streptomyces sp. NPDC056169]|uniref:hypothetical protein n=1 Tax=Streptomyces sp. NPDC056169 TaxID=3345734 RepID=UPI0035E16B41